MSNYSKPTGKIRDTEQLLVTVRLLCLLRIQRSGFGRVNGAVNASGEAHNSAYADQLDLLGEAYKRLDADQMKELTGSEF